MSGRGRVNARREFRPPFKTPLQLKGRASQIPRCSLDAAVSTCSDVTSSSGAALAKPGGDDAAMCAAAVNAGHFLSAPNLSSDRMVPTQQQSADVAVVGGGGNGENSYALVEETRRWIAAAQKAVQYLADTFASGDVACVLAELHIDPLTVLYSTREGRFLEP